MSTTHDDEALREQTRRSIARLISIQRGNDQWNEDDYTTAGNILIVCHRLIHARDEQREREYVKKESAEYHHQEMMRYKASMPSGVDALLQHKPAGGIAKMYEFHKSMYEQLTNPNQQTGEK